MGGSAGRFAAAAGHEVLGVSRSSQSEPGWPGRHLQGDVAQTDLSPVIRRFDPDMVIHAAGSASVPASISDPIGDFRATVISVSALLESVRRSGCDPIVLLPSSAAVYGNPAHLPVGESAACAPISPYGFNKLAFETIGRQYSECFGLSIVLARVFSLFGPLQRRLLTYELYQQFACGGDIIHVQGTGSETRDFLFIDDLSNAMLLLASVAPHGECTIVNAASGDETAIVHLAETIRAIMASPKAIVCKGEVRPGDPLNWRANVHKLRSLIPDWKPRALEEGLRETIKCWRQTGGSLAAPPSTALQ